jgi:hypothetical protein
MHWTTSAILFLVIFTSGWMLFDGLRALIAGDFVTPGTGEYAGQLGPWSRLAEAVRIDPRSTAVKLLFVLYGAAGISMAACYGLGYPWARAGLLVTAILGLWYLPFGTIANILVIILLLLRGPHP